MVSLHLRTLRSQKAFSPYARWPPIHFPSSTLPRVGPKSWRWWEVLTQPLCLWLPVRFSWRKAEQMIASWKDGEAGVFIPLSHPQPKQALWINSGSFPPRRFQLLLSRPPFSYSSLQVLNNSSSVPSGFGQGWQSLSRLLTLGCSGFRLLFLFTLPSPLCDSAFLNILSSPCVSVLFSAKTLTIETLLSQINTQRFIN